MTNNYDADLRDFYAKIIGDADVQEITRDLEAAPGKYRYMKEKVWSAPRARKEDAYGTWIEIVELWEEEHFVYQMVGSRIEQKKETVYHTDIEYWSYGNVNNCIESRYVHNKRRVVA